MNIADVNSWIGLIGVIAGAGIGYGALTQRIASLELRTKALEVVVVENEKEHGRKLDAVVDGMNRLATGVARIEERIAKAL